MHLPFRVLHQVSSTLHKIKLSSVLTFHSHYGDRGEIYPLASDSYIVGLCTGLLASAAISSSRTMGELIPAAVETVTVALRVGLFVQKTRDLIDCNQGKTQSWSMVISGSDEKETDALLNEFSRQKVRDGITFRCVNILTIEGHFSFISSLC